VLVSEKFSFWRRNDVIRKEFTLFVFGSMAVSRFPGAGRVPFVELGSPDLLIVPIPSGARPKATCLMPEALAGLCRDADFAELITSATRALANSNDHIINEIRGDEIRSFLALGDVESEIVISGIRQKTVIVAVICRTRAILDHII
jgi:hypothetical protein